VGSGFAAFGALFVALPTHLVFALARDRQVRELVDNKVLHKRIVVANGNVESREIIRRAAVEAIVLDLISASWIPR
jgi:hypothetical protein